MKLQRVRAVLVTAAALLVVQACTLKRDGGAQRECTADYECDDDRLCTLDRCTLAGVCRSRPSKKIILEQTPGDCQRFQCVAGVFRRFAAEDDIFDDGDPCTLDLCDGKVVVNEVMPPGSNCDTADGPGVCTAGECVVGCTDASMCDDGNDCTVDTCNPMNAVCDYENLDGVAAPNQTSGDCTLVLCEDGTLMDSIDDTDVPNDMDPSDCEVPSCAGGTPVITPKGQGATCGVMMDMSCSGPPQNNCS